MGKPVIAKPVMAKHLFARHWRDAALGLVALLAALGLVRVLLVRTPPAADLPMALRREGPVVPGFRTRLLTVGPAGQGQERSHGRRYRFRLEPLDAGAPLELELMVIRGRDWRTMVPEALAGQRVHRLGPRQELAIGRLDGRPALQTCLVGRGAGESTPTAAVADDLVFAVERWHERVDAPRQPGGPWHRLLAIQGGLRVSRRWECLRVRLAPSGGAAMAEHVDRNGAHNQVNTQVTTDQQVDARKPAEARKPEAELIRLWPSLAAGLREWGEQWQGAGS